MVLNAIYRAVMRKKICVYYVPKVLVGRKKYGYSVRFVSCGLTRPALAVEINLYALIVIRMMMYSVVMILLL